MISPEALYAAKTHLQGVPNEQMLPAIGTVLGKYPGMSLVELIAAHKALTTQMQQQEEQQVTELANQGGGVQPQAPAPTTVAQDTIGQLSQIDPQFEQQIMSRAAQPTREGGIASLDAGRLGEEYATGGIVAFSGKDNDQKVEAKQREEDRANIMDAVQNLGAAGMDVATLPGRGIAGAFESAITRPLNALGVPIPYLPRSFYGGDASSMTPYYDRLQRLRSGEGLMDNATSTTQTNATPIVPVAPADVPRTGVQQATPEARATVAAGPAAESEDSGYTNLMKTLEGNADEGRKLLKSGIQPREVNKTAGEHAAALREQDNAYLKARGLPTAEESMKERIDNLATAGKEARNNRDVDRWMAVAQGFFTMAGGKSQYAMQNMAEGLGMGTKEFRAVEQDYRKVDQLQKDKAELLKEAVRQEARGDFAKGDALRKEIDDRNTKIDAANVAIGERMTANAGTAMGNAIAAKGARDARRDAAALVAQTAANAATGRQDIAKMYEQGRTDRATAAAEQRFADMQVRLQKQHPLILKGTLPNKLTELENARSLLATNPKKQDFIKSVNDLTVQVDRMQDQVAMDTAKDAKRFIKAGNSEWGTLQTTGGTK